ncbi:MAG: hypothetical protein KJN67_00285 [Pontiella sp.]|nr:hypothetical protein [Pontiella sp.]MBT8045575.1 hypothetical protein [Pontiella sp.]NNJ71204.1 hypothetical protein [Kiritimatiellales bacterium]
MHIRGISMMLVAGCVIGLLTGCGIPEDEHYAILAEMDTKFKAEEEKLNSKITDLESLLNNEKAKARSARAELDDATERIKGLQQTNAQAAKALAGEKSKVADLESALASAKSTLLAARDEVIEAENRLSAIDKEYQELKRRFEMFQKNLNALDQSSAAPVAVTEEFGTDVSPAPQTDAARVGSLLDEMGSM